MVEVIIIYVLQSWCTFVILIKILLHWPKYTTFTCYENWETLYIYYKFYCIKFKNNVSPIIKIYFKYSFIGKLKSTNGIHCHVNFKTYKNFNILSWNLLYDFFKNKYMWLQHIPATMTLTWTWRFYLLIE